MAFLRTCQWTCQWAVVVLYVSQRHLVMFVQRLCNNTPEPLEYCYNYPVVLLQGLWNFFTEPYKIIKGKLLPILFS